MWRALTTLMIVLAMFNIVHADILKPCQCGPDNPLSCGKCPASQAGSGDAPAPC